MKRKLSRRSPEYRLSVRAADPEDYPNYPQSDVGEGGFTNQYGVQQRYPEQQELPLGADWQNVQRAAREHPDKYIELGYHTAPQYDGITFPMLQSLIVSDIAQYNRLLHGGAFNDQRFHNLNLLAMRAMIERDPANFVENELWRYEKAVPKNESYQQLLHYAFSEMLEEDNIYGLLRADEEYNIDIPDDIMDKAIDRIREVAENDPESFFDNGYAYNLSERGYEDITRDAAEELARQNPKAAFNQIDNHHEIGYYAADTICYGYAEHYPRDFFEDIYNEREYLENEYNFQIPSDAIERAGREIANTDPDAFRELELHTIPELADVTHELGLQGVFMPSDLSDEYTLESDVEQENFPVLTESGYQNVQRHPEVSGLTRYEFALNVSTQDDEIRKLYRTIMDDYSGDFHSDIGMGNTTKSFALVAFGDDTLYVEEIQSDWPGALHKLKRDNWGKTRLRNQATIEDYSKFVKNVTEHSAAYPYLIVQRLAEFAAANPNIKDINISSLDAVTSFTGGVGNRNKARRIYHDMPKQLGFKPKGERERDQGTSLMALDIFDKSKEPYSEEELRQINGLIGAIGTGGAQHLVNIMEERKIPAYLMERLQNVGFDLSTIDLHRPGSIVIYKYIAKWLAEFAPRVYASKTKFPQYIEFDEFTETPAVLEELKGSGSNWWSFSGDAEAMQQLAERAASAAAKAVKQLYESPKKKTISPRDTRDRRERQLNIEELKPEVAELIGEERAEKIEFSVDVGEFMRSINKLHKDKEITSKEKNQIAGMINKYVIAFLDSLIVKVAEPNDMIRYLSKRAKVKSDKPAYKEKKKTDKGYVWVYDEKHIEKRWKEKKDKLKNLEKNLKKVRDKYQEDLTSEDPKTRAIAAIVGIMDDTAMRIGNEDSAKEGTYGASTLKVKHVKGGPGKMTFDFPGKGAVEQNVTLENNKVIKVVRDLMKGKKKDDFIFEVDGTKIWDRTVNRYLKPFGISAKDLRGFHANRLMKETLKKKDFEEALEDVADIVGHEAATLKNQYLDPELVEKHEGKGEDSKEKKDDGKKKKAALSIRAEELPMASLEEPQPIYTAPEQKQQLVRVDPNRNVSSVSGNTQGFPDLDRAWRIIAPFLPEGATLTSAFRDDSKQVKTILEYWLSVWWGQPSAKDRGFFQTNYDKGAFKVPFRIHKSILRRIHSKAVADKPLTKADLWWVEQVRQIMASYNGNLPGGPKEALDIAPVGESSHRYGTAFDISNASLQDISKAVSYLSNTFPNSLVVADILVEPGNNAVHVELGKSVTMPPMDKFMSALEHYHSNEQVVKRQSLKPQLSKRAGDKPKAGLFAVLPPALSKQFPSLGKHDDSATHTTVLFIGAVPEDKYETLNGIVKDVAAGWKPFKVDLADDVSYFPATKHSDGCIVAKMEVVSDDLKKFHKDLKKAIMDAGIEVDNHFPDYKPHVTLEYMAPPKEEYEGDAPKGSWKIEEVEIWGCGEKRVVKLGKKSASLSSRAALTPQDSSWVNRVLKKVRQWIGGYSGQDNTMGVSQDAKRSMRIRPKVKLTPTIYDAWRMVQPFLPQGAVMTSGARTQEDQIGILKRYFRNSTGRTLPEPYNSMGPNDQGWWEVTRYLKDNFGLVVGPPFTKRPEAHLKGNSFDISGADLYDIEHVIKTLSRDKDFPVKLTALVEDANNAVHVNVKSVQYDARALSTTMQKYRVASISQRDDDWIEKHAMQSLYTDLLMSDPPDHVRAEFEAQLGLKLAEDTEDDGDTMCAADWLDLGDMGFGKEDAMGDWFEKSPMFRFRDEEPEFDIQNIEDSEAKKLAEDDPEKFFYRGLHKDFPELEALALKGMIEDNAKFFFVFKYHERNEDDFQDLVENAAENLSLQDARAFFYYHLHHKFPELGRGAIVQIIDTNPDSFFDLGLQKDYPDYEESAGAARNIKDPNKVELEQPEWLKGNDKSISIRDKNAALSCRAAGTVKLERPLDPDATGKVTPDPIVHKQLPDDWWQTEGMPEGYIKYLSDEAVRIPQSLDEALEMSPGLFLRIKEFKAAYPQAIKPQVEKLIRTEPVSYFIGHYQDNPEYKDLNDMAIQYLLGFNPGFFFDSGLFMRDDFKLYTEEAATKLLKQDPRRLLTITESSPVIMEALKEFIPAAKDAIIKFEEQQHEAREQKEERRFNEKRKEFWKRQLDPRSIGDPFAENFWNLPRRKAMLSIRAEDKPDITLTSEEEKVFEVLRETVAYFKLGTTVRVAGGWVRDKIMGKESKDIDIAIDNMMGKDFAKYVDRYAKMKGIKVSAGLIPAKPEQGKNLETAVIHMFDQSIDVVNLRDEKYDEESRKPTVTITDSPVKDAFRRDLTINALFYNIQTNEVEDFTGSGINDIREGVIRTPTTTPETEEEVGREITPKEIFMDDPLRVLRAIRFANRYGFEVKDDLVEAAKDPEVQDAFRKKITKERVQEELRKIMSERRSPRYALNLIRDWGYRSEVLMLPDEYSEWEMDQNNPHHELSLWDHLMEALDNLYEITKNKDLGKAEIFLLNWATLLHDVGKLDPSIKGTKELEGQIINTYHGHEESSIRAAEHMLRALKGTTVDEIKRIQTLIDAARRMNPQHMDPTEPSSMSRKALGKILQLTKDLEKGWERAIEVAMSDASAHKKDWITEYPRTYWDALGEQFQSMPTNTGTMGPLVSGGELMQMFPNPRTGQPPRKGGPWLGQLNKAMVEWQMENPGATKEQALEFAKNYYYSGGLDKSSALSSRDMVKGAEENNAFKTVEPIQSEMLMPQIKRILDGFAGTTEVFPGGAAGRVDVGRTYSVEWAISEGPHGGFVGYIQAKNNDSGQSEVGHFIKEDFFSVLQEIGKRVNHPALKTLLEKWVGPPLAEVIPLFGDKREAAARHISKLASTTLTEDDLKQMYQLEYQIAMLDRRPVLSHRMEKLRWKLEDQLQGLLKKGYEAGAEAAAHWLEHPVYGQMAKSVLADPTVSGERLGPETIDKIKSMYERITNLRKEFLKGPSGKIGPDMVNFQLLLTTAHKEDSLTPFLPFEGYSLERLLTDLSEGVHTDNMPLPPTNAHKLSGRN